MFLQPASFLLLDTFYCFIFLREITELVLGVVNQGRNAGIAWTKWKMCDQLVHLLYEETPCSLN